MKLINDSQSLQSASRSGYPIKTHDDGYGPLFILRDSMGICGIVRASNWDHAFEICEDEIFPDADETTEDFEREYGYTEKTVKIIRDASGQERPAIMADYPLSEYQFVRWETTRTAAPDKWSENACWQEAFGFRPNGGIYAKDLNGDSLEKLTPELVAALEITLCIASESCEECGFAVGTHYCDCASAPAVA